MNKSLLITIFKRTWNRFYSYKPVKRPNLIKGSSKQSKKPANLPSTGAELGAHLRTKIGATGPITVADYMKEILTNPAEGYYMKKDVFGQSGDFITSPEIGQIFGELIAVWCLTEWQKIGSPSPFQVIEFGPGRGTLSQDILRVFSKLRLGDQFSLHLVEVSPFLSKIQAQRLCFQHSETDENSVVHYQMGETVSGAKVFWYRSYDSVPKEFSIVIAHEFFDALPIHKLQKIDGVWKEILIDIDPKNAGGFRFVISNNQTPVSKIFCPIENESRDSLEYSLETDSIIEKLSFRFEDNGGFALIMDYGHFGDKTDTFRAFKNHKLHDPFLEPGTADLTADVDFKQIKATAERIGKLITFGPVEQGLFLKRMSGDVRLQVLLENCSPENKESIESGYKMLTDPDQMGKRFKFFSMFPNILQDHLKRFPVSGFNE